MQRILVHGRSRSGTTITQRILNTHPRIQIFNESKIYARITNIKEMLKMEKKMYNGHSPFFGNKRDVISLEQFKINDQLNIKYICIYRDGRDSVSSGIRRSSGPKDLKPWRSIDPRVNSKDWADYYFRWQQAKDNIIPPGNFCEIKFEDYIHNAGKNATIIAKFLGIKEKKLINLEKKFIKKNNAHIGYYAKWVPNWEKDFHPDAIKVLELLGYI